MPANRNQANAHNTKNGMRLAMRIAVGKIKLGEAALVENGVEQ